MGDARAAEGSDGATYGFGRIRCSQDASSEIYRLPGPRTIQVCTGIGFFGVFTGCLVAACVGIVEALIANPPNSYGEEVFIVVVAAGILFTELMTLGGFVMPVWFAWRRSERLTVHRDSIEIAGAGFFRGRRFEAPLATVTGVDIFVPNSRDAAIVFAGFLLFRTASLQLTAGSRRIRFGRTLHPLERDWLCERLATILESERSSEPEIEGSPVTDP